MRQEASAHHPEEACGPGCSGCRVWRLLPSWYWRVAVAVVAVVAGSAQAQTTTTLSLAYHTNGDTIAVPGKLHPTETLAGPDGTEYPVAHDDSKAYFRVTASGGGSLFSGDSDGVIASFEYSYANGFGSPTSEERGLIGRFGPPWNLSTVIGMANAGAPTYAKTTGPLTIELVEKDGGAVHGRHEPLDLHRPPRPERQCHGGQLPERIVAPGGVPDCPMRLQAATTMKAEVTWNTGS